MVDKAVWITGASSGLGAELAKQYADLGWRVIASARRLSELEQLCVYNKNIQAVAHDVTSDNADSLRAALAATRSLDLVIANAGTCEYLDRNNFDSGVFSRTMELNVNGVARTLELALPLLSETPSSQFAIVSSLATMMAFPRAAAYGASKAALNYMAKSLRDELVLNDIDVCLIQPGFVRTPLTDLNEFPMPFILEVDDAAQRIVKGLANRKPRIAFPARLIFAVRMLSLLPDALKRKLMFS